MPKGVRVREDAEGNIPLFAAIEAGNINICRELLEKDTELQVKHTKVGLTFTYILKLFSRIL